MPIGERNAADRYSRMRWNTPLSEEHAALLLARLDVAGVPTILDLGCGWGELLLRAVFAAGGVQGVGVDSDDALLRRAEAAAAERGLRARVRFVQQPAAAWLEPADRVICVGASQAWGSVEEALESLHRLTLPGGRLLFGEGCWERSPTEAAAAIFATTPPLPALVDRARSLGWRVLSLTTADQREWDDFESTWRAAREERLLAHPNGTDIEAERAALDDRLTEYLTIYRGVLSFVYLVLAKS